MTRLTRYLCLVLPHMYSHNLLILLALTSDAQSAGLIKYRDPYPFGVDPSWRGSRSELPFLNSLKMKMSILLGVVQMNLGIIMSYFNARYFESSLDIRCVFPPRNICLLLSRADADITLSHENMLCIYLSSFRYKA